MNFESFFFLQLSLTYLIFSQNIQIYNEKALNKICKNFFEFLGRILKNSMKI